MNIIFDPKIFNYIILGLYAITAARWAAQGSWGDTAYWAGAFWITSAVTWGYSR